LLHKTAKTPTTAATGALVVVGLDGGYVRNRHPAEGRRFEVIAGKVIHAAGAQHRFAFARTGPAVTAEAFRQALAATGMCADRPATVRSYVATATSAVFVPRLSRPILLAIGVSGEG